MGNYAFVPYLLILVERFMIPHKNEGVSAADVVDLYLQRVKESLGLYSGRETVSTTWRFQREKIWLEKYHRRWPNTWIWTIPLDSPFTHLDDPQLRLWLMLEPPLSRCVTFGWSNAKMAGEYISTSKAAVKNVANKLLGTESNNPGSSRQMEPYTDRKQIINISGQLPT